MAINDVLGLTVEVSATTDNFVKALQDAAAAANLDMNVKDPFLKSFKSAQADIKGVFAKTVADAASTGLGKARIDKFIAKLQPLTDDIEKSMKAIFEQEVKIRKGGLDAASKKEAEDLLAMEKSKLAGLNTRLKIESRAADKIIKRRKQAVEEAERLASRTRSEAVEEFGEGITKAFDDLKSGNVAGIFKGVGKRAGAHGELLKEKGGAKGGMVGGLMSGMGKLLAGLGPILMAVGALAALIGALVAVFVGADAKAKQLNNTLLDSGVAAGELEEAFGDATDGLTALRKEFINFGDNVTWGTTAKDTLEIIGAFGKAGVVLRELTSSAADGADAMDKLRNATEATLTYAKLLGTTNVEMAEVFASRMQDMGLNINGVAENLSAVHMAAKESGFGVKRFFNMVLQATTGMSMYNVRMSEAAGLLLRLGKILGATQGGEFLQGLTKGFVDESTQDKYKRVMTTGGGRTKATFERSAANTAEDFIQKLDAKGMGGAMGAAIEKSGLKVNLGDSKQLVKDLGALSRDDQTKLLAAARMGGDDELVQQLTNLTMVSQGAKGGTGNMAMSLGGLDMGGKLMMQLQQGMAVLGKPLHELGAVETMAFENMTGVQGEQLEQLRRVSQAMYGNHKVLTDLSKNAKEEYAGLTKEQLAAEQARQVGAYGAYVAENGDIIAAKLEDVQHEDGTVTKKVSEEGQKTLSKDIGSYIQSQGDVFAQAAKDSLDANTILAQEMVAATTELTKLMEQGVESWLESINGVVESILNVMTGGKEVTSRQTALDRLAGEMRATREKVKAGEKEIAEKRAEMVTETPEGKARLLTEIESKQAQLQVLQKGYALAQEDRRQVMREVTTVLGNRSASEITGPLKTVPLTEEMAGKVAVGGAQIAVDAWLKHRFDTSDKGEYMEKYSGKEWSTEQLEDYWNAAEFFAQRHGAKAAEAAAGGRQYQVPDTVMAVKQKGFWGNMAEGLGSWGPWGDSLLELMGYPEKSFTGKQKGSGEVYTSATGWRAGFGTPEDLDEFRKVIASADYDPVILAAHKDQKEAERKQKELMGKGGEAPKANADALEPVLERVLALREEIQIFEDLQNILDQAGVSPPPAVVSGWAKDIGEQRMPAGLRMLLGKEAVPGVGGAPGKTVQDLLRDKGHMATGAPAAKDFLMHIGSDGQVKFAQRIDGADGVTAVATKGGGGVDSAMRGAGGGGGGVTIVQHNYSDMEAIKKGYRSMMAARALG